MRPLARCKPRLGCDDDPFAQTALGDEAAEHRLAAPARIDIGGVAAVGFSGADTPPGCLLASGAIACSAAAADVQGELAAPRRVIEARLCARIACAIDLGELAIGTDADGLAGHVMAVIQGLSTLARDGAAQDKLLRVAATAMASWPVTDPIA